MKLLLIADHEERYLWDDWNQETRKKLADIGLILSAGDLDADYLEFRTRREYCNDYRYQYTERAP